MNKAERNISVMHIITGLNVGGAETQLVNLVIARRRVGALDRVVSLVSNGIMVGRLEDAGVPVDDLGMRRGRPKLSGLIKLICLIRRYRPQIVQSWMYHADLISTLALRVSGRWGQTRLIWGLRCSNMNLSDYGRSLKLTINICARYSYLPDLIVANSDAGLQAHEKLGYYPKLSRVIPNGIDTDKFKPNAQSRSKVRLELGIEPNAMLVAHVARVDPMKDHETLLRATQMVPDVKVILIGLGTEKYSFQSDQYYCLGSRNDIPNLLAACDIIASSSAYGEGFSNAIAEGMSSGLVPVSTNVGDITQIIGDLGIVVPPRQPQALGLALQKICNESRELHIQRRAEVRTRIERCYSTSEHLNNYNKLYMSII